MSSKISTDISNDATVQKMLGEIIENYTGSTGVIIEDGSGDLANLRDESIIQAIKDAYEYGSEFLGAVALHAKANGLINATTSDMYLAVAMGNSNTNMLLNLLPVSAFEKIKGNFYQEFILPAALTSAGVGTVDFNSTSPNKTYIPLTGLTAGNYYVLLLCNKKAVTVSVSATDGTNDADIILNTVCQVSQGLAAGVNMLLFKAVTTTPKFYLQTADNSDCGVTTATTKCYAVTIKAANQIKLIMPGA